MSKLIPHPVFSSPHSLLWPCRPPALLSLSLHLSSPPHHPEPRGEMSVCVYFFDANSNQLALSPSLFGGGMPVTTKLPQKALRTEKCGRKCRMPSTTKIRQKASQGEEREAERRMPIMTSGRCKAAQTGAGGCRKYSWFQSLHAVPLRNSGFIFSLYSVS